VSFDGGGSGRCCGGDCSDVGVDRPLVCALVFAVLFAYEEVRLYSLVYLGLPLLYEGVCMCVRCDN
jgi:hypothetical protein